MVENPEVMVTSMKDEEINEEATVEGSKLTKFGFCHYCNVFDGSMFLAWRGENSCLQSTYGRTRQADSPWPTQGDAAATTASAPDTAMILKNSHALWVLR